ncbi:6935_t:CDS:2 [Cetraspora pellucida]|uniref:6935_t:CDS:1 n=1 Tax=Cetraspora pellucida TaxID=1433469 RepID=A0ACA9LBJ6_9GLOM|nr:6935_t:CDS:2 [Cetraspora pellucida]
MDTTDPIDINFITMFKRFLQNQNQINQYLTNMTQQQQATNDHLQMLVTETSKLIETLESIFNTDTRDQRNARSKGLNVHLSVFSRKDSENYIITRLKDAALQWYLNLVQADETVFQPPHYQQLLRHQLRELRQTFMVQEYARKFRNLLGQIEKIAEPDKVMYFTEGLKGATKAEINYWALKTLNEAVKLTTSYDLAMYRTKNNYNYSLRRNTRSSEESWKYKNTPSYVPQS